MTAISGTRRSMKELVDGTIRVQIDIDPKYRAEFFEMFPEIDMPVALAPLVGDFEQKQPVPEKKGGKLAQDAALICQDYNFQRFAYESSGGGVQINGSGAAIFMRKQCNIESRSELDHNPDAAKKFADLMKWYWKWQA